METVLLVGPAPAGVAEAAALRGLALIPPERAPVARCRVALIAPRHDAVLPADAPPDLRRLVVVDGEAHVAAALDGGADDVVVEDASAAQIAARLAALVRRTTPPAIERFGSLTVDRLERQAWRDGRALALLPREYAVLLVLLRNAGSIVSRTMLRKALWGNDFNSGTNVIEVHVSRLRAKLDHGAATPMLHTEKRAGYRLVADR